MKLMKLKHIIIAALFVLFAWGSAWSGEKTLTFQWEQALSDDFAGWRLYKSEVAGGPYVKHGDDILFVFEQQTYESAQVFASPDNETHIYYFVIIAFDTGGNESGYSNEVSVQIDFQAPAAPTLFSVTVTVVAQ